MSPPREMALLRTVNSVVEIDLGDGKPLVMIQAPFPENGNKFIWEVRSCGGRNHYYYDPGCHCMQLLRVHMQKKVNQAFCLLAAARSLDQRQFT